MKDIEFGANKKKTMILASVLSVNKSYDIIKLLLKEPLMLKTISKKLHLKSPIIYFHIMKLDEAGILTIIIKKDADRNKQTPYYGVRPFTLSLPKRK